MTNDVVKLNAIVSTISHNLAELAILGQEGDCNIPLTITPTDFVEMVGQPTGPIGSWQPQSKDLLWFQALKLTVQARQMLEQSARRLQQMDDGELAREVESALDALDEHFHPAETALRVYGKLLTSELSN